MSSLPSLLDGFSNSSSLKIASLLTLGPVTHYIIKHYIKASHYAYLETATQVRGLEHLDELLENRQRPLFVCVSGKVGSDEPHKVTTIVNLQNEVNLCVTYEGKTEIIYEHMNKDGDQFSSLMELNSIREETAWYLHDDGTVKVNVEGIQLARGFDSIANKREVAGPGIVLLRELALAREINKYLEDGDGQLSEDGIQSANVFDMIANNRGAETPPLRELAFVRQLDGCRGIKVIGVKHLEYALKVDSDVTIYGVAVKEANGITIREPFLVCATKDSKEIKSNLFRRLSPWDIGLMYAFVAGLAIFVDQGLQKLS